MFSPRPINVRGDVDFEMCRLSSRCKKRIAEEIKVARSYIGRAEAGAGPRWVISYRHP